MENFNSAELNEEVSELLDLYVVGALDDNEISEVKSILSVSPSAKNYIDEQRALLSRFEEDTPSNPILFDSIKKELSKSNKVTNISTERRTDPASKPKYSYLAIAASFVAIVVSLSLVLLNTNSSNDNTASKPMDMKKEMAAFTKQDSTQVMSLTNDKSDLKVELAMNKNGQVMLDGRNLGKLSPTETYQLWAIVGDSQNGEDAIKIVSASVLGNNPNISMTHVDGDIKGFAITKEVSGGVTSSDQTPVYSYMIA